MPTSARTRFFAGPVSGRTHRSAPTRWGGVPETRRLVRRRTFPGRDGARSLQGERNKTAAGCAWGAAGCGHTALRKQRWQCAANGPPRSSAPTERRGSCRNHPGQRRTAERLRQWSQGTTKNRRKDHQKGIVLFNHPGSALSAEIVAGQIQVLPDDLFVRHGGTMFGSLMKAPPVLS